MADAVVQKTVNEGSIISHGCILT